MGERWSLCFRRGRSRNGSAGSDTVDPDRLGDGLEVLLAHILERSFELALRLAVGVAGEADTARLGQGL